MATLPLNYSAPEIKNTRGWKRIPKPEDERWQVRASLNKTAFHFFTYKSYPWWIPGAEQRKGGTGSKEPVEIIHIRKVEGSQFPGCPAWKKNWLVIDSSEPAVLFGTLEVSSDRPFALVWWWRQVVGRPSSWASCGQPTNRPWTAPTGQGPHQNPYRMI